MKSLTLILAIAAILCGTMLAQQVDSLNVRFNAPVVVGETTLPAGDCHIQVVRGSGDNVLLVFRSTGKTITALVSRLYSLDESSEGTRVVLNKETSRVDRILMGDGTGFQLIQ
jgi:hypothetical protein